MLKHLAVVMDGNRRWAKRLGLQPWKGHQKGAEAVGRIVEFCLGNEIPYLSLYTFSIENFKRSDAEKRYLFDLLTKEMMNYRDEFIKKGVRVRFIGDRSLFPRNVLHTCEQLEQETEQLNALNLNFLFCYGGRQEIIGGIKKLMRRVKDGQVHEDEISDELFKEFLWTRGIPEPDLIIRTGGHRRLSNFLLYQAAYSELHFLDCLWPEITNEHLTQAINDFTTAQRNFGT